MNNLELQDQFNISSSVVKNLKTRPSNEELLIIYGLYKQATVGDCDIPKPSGILNIKDKSKWESWKKLESMSKEEAMLKYVKCVEFLVVKYNK